MTIETYDCYGDELIHFNCTNDWKDVLKNCQPANISSVNPFTINVDCSFYHYAKKFVSENVPPEIPELADHPLLKLDAIRVSPNFGESVIEVLSPFGWFPFCNDSSSVATTQIANSFCSQFNSTVNSTSFIGLSEPITTLIIYNDSCTFSTFGSNCEWQDVVCQNILAVDCNCPTVGFTRVLNSCIDIDECLIFGTCPNGTRCINLPGSFYCQPQVLVVDPGISVVIKNVSSLATFYVPSSSSVILEDPLVIQGKNNISRFYPNRQCVR